MKTRIPGFGYFMGAAIVCGAAFSAQAQTIYRIVGADGKVTFSDKPPASTDQGKVLGTGVGAAGAAASSTLPFELKQVQAKYPVTLYTAAKCAPCDSGRALLSVRGVPFNERTVMTAEDTDYLQRLTGESSLPYITIGGQRHKGFSESEWNSTLDAAGYPKSSMLPSGYRNAPPSPLVTIQKAAAPKPEEKPAADLVAPPLTPPGPTPSNPAGIAF
jgi:glutaredoxin